MQSYHQNTSTVEKIGNEGILYPRKVMYLKIKADDLYTF